MDKLNLKINVIARLKDKEGNLLMTREAHNALTTVGVNGIMDQLLLTPTIAKPTHMELGTGTGGTTKLNLYITGSRTAFTSKTRAGAVLTMISNFAAGVGTGTISEAGVFNSATQDAGDMYNYVEFGTPIPKGADDTLELEWTITASVV